MSDGWEISILALGFDAETAEDLLGEITDIVHGYGASLSMRPIRESV